MAERFEPTLRPYEPSVWDRLGRAMMGDSRSSWRRQVVEGLLGTSGLGDSDNLSVRGLVVPETAGDAALMALGPAARYGGRAAAKAVGAAAGGLLGAETTEAEAGIVGSGRKGARNIVQRTVDAVSEPNPRAVIGGNNPPPDRPRVARAPVTDDGLAVKGKEYTKAQQATLREMAGERPGIGPIDLDTPPAISAPQAPMDRFVPPRGVSARLQRAMENDEVLEGMRASIRRGQEMGAGAWYHNDAIRQEFVKELGPEAGAREFKRYMDYTAATSPRSDVSTNIRNASYYYMMDGKELPASLPYPYGHVAQNLHRQNAAVIQNGGFDIYKNPKPASFSENLQGNLVPVTVDTHAFRNIAMRTRDPEFLETSISVPYKQGKALEKLDDDERELLTMAERYGEISKDGKKVIFRPRKLLQEGRLTMDEALKMPSFWASKPNANEYGAAEQLWTRLGAEMGLAPADAQAAGWAGAGDLTGLKSPATKTFPQLFNERVEYTARMRGEDPRETLRAFIRKEKPLLSVAPAAGVALPGLLGGAQQYED